MAFDHNMAARHSSSVTYRSSRLFLIDMLLLLWKLLSESEPVTPGRMAAENLKPRCSLRAKRHSVCVCVFL